MLPRSLRQSEDDLPKQVAGRYPRRGESSDYGADRCTAIPPGPWAHGHGAKLGVQRHTRSTRVEQKASLSSHYPWPAATFYDFVLAWATPEEKRY